MNTNNCIDTSYKNPSFSTSNDVAEITKPLTKLGISYFTYTRVEKNGGRIYVTNAPEVLEGYLKGNYYLSGNTEGCPLHRKPQIALWDTLPNQTILDENARAKNYDHGMFIIEPGVDYCDYYGFATHKGNETIINTYLTKLDYLESFAASFKETAKDLIQTVAKNKIVLPFSNYHIDFAECDSTTNESITLQHEFTRMKFTPRQLTVAQKFIDGKGIKNIAKEMKLSPRTIEQHINALKQKLNCTNSIELAVKLSKLLYTY